MKATDFLTEGKKDRRDVKRTVKPRNPVAHAAQTVAKGSGAHKDKSKEIPRKAKHKTADTVGTESLQQRLDKKVSEKMNIPFAGEKVGQKEGPKGQWRNDGPSANRPARRNDLVGGESVTNEDAGASAAILQAKLAKLEELMPSVAKISQNNHYVFEEIEAEIMSILHTSEELEDKSHATDIKDAVEEAIQLTRQANGAVYNIEKTLKDLIRYAHSEIEDIESQAEYDARFGKKEESVKEGAKVDRMVKHIASSEKKSGKSAKDAEDIAWATANKRGMLDNKNKKK